MFSVRLRPVRQVRSNRYRPPFAEDEVNVPFRSRGMSAVEKYDGLVWDQEKKLSRKARSRTRSQAIRIGLLDADKTLVRRTHEFETALTRLEEYVKSSFSFM